MDILITNAGMAALINAEKTGTNAVKITELAVGSAKYTADKTQTKLKAETKRLPIIEAAKVGDTGIHVGVRDDSTDAYSVFEFGLLLEDGTLFAVYSQNAPILTKTADSIAQMVVDVALEGVKTERITFGDVHYDFPAASEANAGIVELATQSEAEAGTDALRVVTVKVLAALKAREDLAGIIRKASSAETLAGVADDAAVTPKTLQDRIATDGDVDAGTVGKILTTDIAKRQMNILEKSIEAMYAAKRTGKVYGVKIPKYSFNTTTDCVKILDNENLVCEASTEGVRGRDDYADIPLFNWVDVNYVRDEDGAARPTAIRGMTDFKESGSVDVGVMMMSFWYKKDDVSDPDYSIVMLSDSPHPELGLHPWVESVKRDGSVLPWCVGSKYISGLAEDGLLRSQSGLRPECWMSHNKSETEYQKKGVGYHGAGAERATFQDLFLWVKYAQKSSQKVFQGTSAYWVDVMCSTPEENVTRVVVSNSDAGKILNGSRCMVGRKNEQYGADPNTSEMQEISGREGFKLIKKEPVGDANTALVFDAKSPFTTTLETCVKVLAWDAGTTDNLPDHCDGQVANGGRYPYRLQGREFMNGGYFVEAGSMIEKFADGDVKWYAARRWDAHNGSTETYKLIGTTPKPSQDSTYVADIAIDYETGAWYPTAWGASSAVGTGDAIYSIGSGEGLVERLQGGYSWSWSAAGASCLDCWTWLGGAYWRFSGGD